MTYEEALAAAWGVVRRFAARAAGAGALTQAEAEQAGRLGVWRAWKTFDGRKASWRTYATLWVRAYVYREAGFDHTYDRPKSVAERRLLRLDAELGAGDPRTLGDLVPCPRASPEAVVVSMQEARRVIKALMVPPERERRRETSFDAGRAAVDVYVRGETQADVAERLGVTRQAVQQAISERLKLARGALEGV